MQGSTLHDGHRDSPGIWLGLDGIDTSLASFHGPTRRNVLWSPDVVNVSFFLGFLLPSEIYDCGIGGVFESAF